MISKLSLQPSTVVEAMDAHSAPTVLRTSVITMIVREFSDGTVDQVIEEVTAIDGETVDRPVSAGYFRPTVDIDNASLNGTLDGNIQFELMRSARAMSKENARLSVENTRMALALAAFEGAASYNSTSGIRSATSKGDGKNQTKGSAPY